jgi:hypothetical protein
LRVVGARNPRFANVSPARFYSKVEVIEVQEAKLTAKGKTLTQWKAEQDARSLRVKVGKAKAKQQRAEDIVRGLEALGITYDDEGPAYKYIGLH